MMNCGAFGCTNREANHPEMSFHKVSTNKRNPVNDGFIISFVAAIYQEIPVHIFARYNLKKGVLDLIFRLAASVLPAKIFYS